MLTRTSTAAISAALAIGLSGAVVPVATAAPVNLLSSLSSTNGEPVAEPAPFGGDKSQGCTLDWESASTLTEEGLEHHSKVTSPYEGEENTSAGALEVHGWGARYIRVPVTAAYPVEAGATLTVTLPEGASQETVTYQESGDNWIIDRYYGAPYFKASVAEYFGEPTWEGNVVTFTSIQRIPKNAAFDLRFTAQGGELIGETRAKLDGEWDPLHVALAYERPRIVDGVVANHANDHAVPDCFRPATEIRDGNRTERCDVDWVADAVLDRRFLDWTNNGFIYKVKSPRQTEAPAEASAPGSMELQHYFVGGDTLILRLPVATDEDMTDARLVFDLPGIEGYEWQVDPSGAPFYPVQDYRPLTPLPEGQIVGNQAVYEIGDFPAGTAFTAKVSMKITPEKFDELTAPQDGEWNNLFHPSANLTGTYPEGVEDCGTEPAPGGSAGGSAAIGLGLSALAGSALLSSGSGSAVPDGSVGDSDQPAGEGPATEITDEQPAAPGDAPATGPVTAPDPKVQAQQQAQNAQVRHAAPAAQQATAPKQQGEVAQAQQVQQAQQSQLANTGVSGTLTVVAMGLLAALAGAAALMFRRRA